LSIKLSVRSSIMHLLTALNCRRSITTFSVALTHWCSRLLIALTSLISAKNMLQNSVLYIVGNAVLFAITTYCLNHNFIICSAE
jgi:hypothetical protein